MLVAVLLAGPAVAGRGAEAQAAAAPVETTEQATSIHGVVMNAKTGQPVGRVLVQVEGQSLLTGYDGNFEFFGLNGSTTGVRVTKPGYYQGLDPYQSAEKQAVVGSADEVRVPLYPEALLTGTVSAANGDPLNGIQLQALRLLDYESGPRWTMAGQATSNADGQFRLPLPGGDYVVETQYAAAKPGTHGAILPVMVPAGANGGSAGGSNGASTLRLASGTEQHLELHPPVRPTHTVHLLIDSAGGAEFAPQIQAHLPNGLVFSPMQSRGDRQGEVVVSLPNGSYRLSASTGFRDDAASFGETQVTVADEDVSGVTIHLQKALELPVEVAIDQAAVFASPAGASGAELDPGGNPAVDPRAASFVQQLGIYMQRLNPGVDLRTENVSPASRQGDPVGFSLLPGVYRLRSQGYSQWYVELATAGGTDLLTQELVVDGGSSSVPLRLVVNNQVATIKGTTKLGGQAAQCWVSLIATTPSTTGVITSMSAADGSFARGVVPPGSYRVVATETRLHFDLSDPSVQKQLAAYTKTVTLAAGETGSVDLDAMPASEMKP